MKKVRKEGADKDLFESPLFPYPIVLEKKKGRRRGISERRKEKTPPKNGTPRSLSSSISVTGKGKKKKKEENGEKFHFRPYFLLVSFRISGRRKKKGKEGKKKKGRTIYPTLIGHNPGVGGGERGKEKRGGGSGR